MTVQQTPAAAPKVRLGLNYWKLWWASLTSNLGDGAGMIAYLWVASAVTRNPVLIALIAVAQQLPWLIFTLPAGVITDRVDRRKILVSMDFLRAALMVVLGVGVLLSASSLPTVAEVTGGIDLPTNVGLYLVLMTTALLRGMAEVLRDNTAQTFLPAIVGKSHLEKANGNLWGAEMVANQFVGPPIGSILLGIGFAIPFFVTGAGFALAALLILTIKGEFRPKRAPTEVSVEKRRGEFVGDIKRGFGWLWKHPLLRPMAIILGLMNALGMVTFSVFILFAQEELDLGTGLFTGVLAPMVDFFGMSSVAALTFALLMMGGAVGGVIGAVVAPRVSRAMGPGPALALILVAQGLTALIIGLSTKWWMVWLMFLVVTFTGAVWNVITVSLRQTIIPDDLLGRVNSVYRFFAWGMMPIGSLVGGGIASLTAVFASRSLSLRMPFLVASAAGFVLLVYALPRLTSQKIESARREAEALTPETP